MTNQELHHWASRMRSSADATLREVAEVVLWLLAERAELATTEFYSLREDRAIARSAVANYEREFARLRAAQNSVPAPWETSPRPLPAASPTDPPQVATAGTT